ncbi:MAG: hypothetical protein WC217_00865 [Candidatus Paceibacterota bacterium]|jgi:hypothetical protein
MNPEKSYQPSNKEIKKAEGIMTDDQRVMSKDREIEIQDERLSESWSSEFMEYVLSKGFEGGLDMGSADEIPRLKRNFDSLPLDKIELPPPDNTSHNWPDSIKLLPSGFVFSREGGINGGFTYRIDSGDELRDNVKYEIESKEKELKELMEEIELLRKTKEALGRKLGK